MNHNQNFALRQKVIIIIDNENLFATLALIHCYILN